MKIYSKFTSDPELTEWGILVPLLRSRATQIYEELEKSHKLNGKINSLSSYQLSKADLILAGHDEQFVSDLFSGEDAKIDPLLMETYELIKPDGSIEDFWSLPHIFLSNVTCLSTHVAPKATDANVVTNPYS